jgi:membrane-bound ClpP family serine protease
MGESPATTPPMAGKGTRVVGTFLFLLGAGIVLESAHRWMGGTLMLGGIAALVRGALDARPHTVVPSHPQVAIDAHGESRP